MQIQLKCTNPAHAGDNATLGTIELPDDASQQSIKRAPRGVMCATCAALSQVETAEQTRDEKLRAICNDLKTFLALPASPTSAQKSANQADLNRAVTLLMRAHLRDANVGEE